MVIRKMNSVFARHGRVIFGLITIVIIIAFMGFMQPGSGLMSIFSSLGKKNAVGEVFGKAVTRDDIIQKANYELIVTDIMYNIGLNNYAIANRVQANAFNNLSFLAAAERRGITASDKEVADFIFERAKFRNPKTQKFDKKLYSKYIDEELKSNGFNAADLDNAVREYLIKDKLLDELRNSVVVTDAEVREFYRLLNENFYASYGVFNQSKYLDKVKVSTEEAKKYFAHYTPDMQDYIPGKSKVLLVEFRYDAPEIKALTAKKLTDKAVKEFYSKNKNLFIDKSIKLKKGEKPEALPFEKVKGKAKNMLADRYAKKAASEKAAKFAEAAYDTIGDIEEGKQRKAFEELVISFKYKAIATDWLSDNAKEVSGIKEPKLIHEISSSREVPVSNSVNGTEAAYVAFIVDRIMPRPALFDEIKDKLIMKIKSQKALQMARSQGREFVAKLQKMDKTSRLKTVVDSKYPKFKMLKAFSLMTQPRTQYGSIITDSVRYLKNGDIAPLRNIPEGAIVVMLRKRILPAMAEFDKKKEMLTNIYKQQKTAATEGAFYAWMQTKCKQIKPE